MIKKISLVLVLIFTLLTITGCNNRTDYEIQFKKEMVLDLNSKQSPIYLIDKIDGTKIKTKDIERNKIVYRNFVIKCDTEVDTSKAGQYSVIFSTNDVNRKELRQTINVRDISKPIVSLKKKKITKYIDELKDIDYYSYFSVKDNSGEKELITNIDTSSVEEKVGTYKIKITVEDSSYNKSSKYLKLIVKERPVEVKEPEPQNDTTQSNSNSSSSNSNGNKSSNNSNDSEQNNSSNNSSSSPSKPSVSNPSQYNKFFEGNSISSYNDAYAYAESIFSSGKVNSYNVMPNGSGFQVSFN